MTTTCGWCMTGDHDHCKPYVEYEGRRWECSCLECKAKRNGGK